jgi:hypothetical protein
MATNGTTISGKISWVTPAGDLGTYAEGLEFSLNLQANNPATGALIFRVITGKLPPGVQLYQDGRLYGIPNVLEAGTDTARPFTFTIRASNARGQLADRTFTIRINSIIPPQLLGVEDLGAYYDSDLVKIRLLYADTNAGSSLVWSIASGKLPAGLELTQEGIIQGYALAPPVGGPAGSAAWDVGDYDIYSWDFEGATLTRSYQFRVRLFDGILYTDKQYQITITAKSYFLIDNSAITADSEFTVDQDGYTYPVVITDPTDLVPVRSNRNYAFKFNYYYPNPNVKVKWRTYPGSYSNGETFDQMGIPFDTVGYDQDDLNLPNGLVLDKETGWLTGTIGEVLARNNVYTFQVVAYIEVPISATAVSVRESRPVQFKLNILDSVNDMIEWDTAANLGIIDNGRISTLDIRAHVLKAGMPVDLPLKYSIRSGEYSRLPQGLSLLSTGHIAGRTTFDYFSMDRQARLVTTDLGKTTFDSFYTFTVTAETEDGYIYGFKQFTLTVRNVNKKPFENLYIPAFLPQRLRDTFRTALSSVSTIGDGTEVIYRSDDPWFGIPKDFKFLAMVGLRPNTPAEYIQNMVLFHKDKEITFNDLKWAVALDENYNPKYEVVYFEVNDYNNTAKNTAGSGRKQATLSRYEERGSVGNVATSAVDLIELGELVTTAEDYGTVVESLTTGTSLSGSNSFGNMTEELIQGIGYEFQGALPEWMESVQPDTGQALGFTRAVVLAYCKPGYGKQLAFRYVTNQTTSGFGVNALINQYSFIADRYRLDRSMTLNYNVDTEKFARARTTSFDRIPSIGKIDRGPWVAQDVDVTEQISSIDYGNNEYIAVGQNSVIITSGSGETWTRAKQYAQLSYKAALANTASFLSTALVFPYGTDFSAGDKLVDHDVYTVAYSYTPETYITSVGYYITPSEAVVGTVPAGTQIEFITFTGTRFSLPLAQTVTTGNSNMVFANIATLSRGYTMQIKGIDTANACATSVVGVNTITLTKPLSNAIPSGTSVTFDDLSGNVVSLITTSVANAGTSSLVFASNGNVKSGWAVTLSNIAVGTRVQSLYTVVNLNQSIPTQYPQGLEVFFKNVITADSLINDTVINFSSTERIGIGSVVYGESKETVSLDSASWNDIYYPGTSANITVPSADIVGIRPFVGMTVNANSLPKDSVITTVESIGSNTHIQVSFASVGVTQEVKTAAGDSSYIIGSANTMLIALDSLTNVNVNDYVTASNISIDYKTTVITKFTGNNSILVGPVIDSNVNIVSDGDSVAIQNAKYGNPIRTVSAITSEIIWSNTATSSAQITSLTVSDIDKIYLNDRVTSANIVLNDRVQVIGKYANNRVFLNTAVQSVNPGDIINLLTPASLTMRLDDVVYPGTIVTSKTATSVTLSSPLKTDLKIGFDDAVRFGLATNELNGITYASGVWVAVGGRGLVVSRDDQGNWTQITATPYGDLYAVVKGGAYYVAVGSEGVATRSTNLRDWSPPIGTPARGILQSIDYHDGYFVAVGDNGFIIESQDGNTWTRINSPTTLDLKAVRYTGGQWIAVGQKGTVLLSTDRDEWISYDSGVTDTLNDVTYVNNQYVAVGNNGTILDSESGTEWYRRDSNTKTALLAINHQPAKPVAVGVKGTILVQSSNFTVRWAIRGITFELFNNRTLADLKVLGYGVEEGDELIFAQQEGFDSSQFRGSEFSNEGWNLYTTPFGAAELQASFDAGLFDNYTVVPGFTENQLDGSISNKRAGIWQVNIDENNIVSLNFVRQIQLTQIVTVIEEGNKLVYNPTIQAGKTVPTYTQLTTQLNASTTSTVFDTNSTRFSSPRDAYVSDTDAYDKYLKFPQTGVYS